MAQINTQNHSMSNSRVRFIALHLPAAEEGTGGGDTAFDGGKSRNDVGPDGEPERARDGTPGGALGEGTAGDEPRGEGDDDGEEAALELEGETLAVSPCPDVDVDAGTPLLAEADASVPLADAVVVVPVCAT